MNDIIHLREVLDVVALEGVDRWGPTLGSASRRVQMTVSVMRSWLELDTYWPVMTVAIPPSRMPLSIDPNRSGSDRAVWAREAIRPTRPSPVGIGKESPTVRAQCPEGVGMEQLVDTPSLWRLQSWAVN